MSNLLIADAVWVVFDVETTGLDAFSGDKVCEIAALKIKGAEIIGRFYSLVNPQRAISRGAFMIHGLTEDLLRPAPPWEIVLPDFLKFIENHILVAYNIDFDISFINAARLKQNQPRITNPGLDLLALARRLAPGMRRYNLDTVAAGIGIAFGLRHRAQADCELAYKVFLHFTKLLAKNNVLTVEEILRFK